MKWKKIPPDWGDWALWLAAVIMACIIYIHP